MGVVLAPDELQRVENDPQASPGLAHLPISRGQLIQGLGLEQLGMLCPIQREAVQGCGVMLGAAHREEFSLPAFVRVLEKGKKDPASDLGKAYPEAFLLLLHLEEVQEDVHRREDA